MNNAATYDVTGNGFNLFMDAVRFAQTANADVVEVATGLTRWTPLAKKATRFVQHVLVQADGTTVPLTRKSAKAAMKGKG